MAHVGKRMKFQEEGGARFVKLCHNIVAQKRGGAMIRFPIIDLLNEQECYCFSSCKFSCDGAGSQHEPDHRPY
jgi:hypothetical protein